jgi:hypothetical protein
VFVSLSSSGRALRPWWAILLLLLLYCAIIWLAIFLSERWFGSEQPEQEPQTHDDA